MSDLALMVALGLAGSLHCVQMCGPIVLAFGLPMAGQSKFRQLTAHGAYHAGRISTYALLGALAGWLGQGASVLSRLAGVERWASVGIGILMIIGGVLLAGVFGRSELVRLEMPGPLSRVTGRFLRASGLKVKLAAGLLLGCMPCGLVYAALLRSAASASVWQGAGSMAAFGLGMAGPLLGVGVFSSVINRRLGLSGPRLAAVGVALMGGLLVWRGMLLPMSAHMHHGH